MAPSVIDSSANLTAEHEIKPVSSAIHPDFIDRSDADFLEYYNKHIAPRPVTHGVTIKQMRENPEKYTSEWARDYSGEPFVKDIELTADDGHVFTARIYNPDEKTSPFGSGPYPIYINFHGKSKVYWQCCGIKPLLINSFAI